LKKNIKIKEKELMRIKTAEFEFNIETFENICNCIDEIYKKRGI
jgi:hypothetical protein